MTTATTTPGLRVLLRVDAALETALAVACAVLAFGLLGTDRWRLPPWLGTPALIVIAVVLLLAAVVLWWLAGRPDSDTVRAVAIANGVTTVVILAWALAGLGTGVEMRVLLAATAVLLGALAATQYAHAQRHSPGRRPDSMDPQAGQRKGAK